MRYSSYQTITVVITCLLLPSCSSKKPKAKTPVPVVDVIVARAQPLTNIIEVNGTVVANQFVQLHPDVAGRITYLNVNEGKRISKGTVIANIYSEDLKAQLNKSKAQLELAIKTEERLRKLLAINGVNQADYDSAVNQVKSTKADIGYYTALIDKTIIKAPFTGVLGLRMVSLGAYVSNADVIATLQQTDNLKVDFTIPDEYGAVIHPGDSVSMLADGLGQVRHKAVVVATEPEVNTLTRNIKVRAIIINNPVNIGAFVKVYVDAGTNKSTIMVPTSSIIPDDKSNKVVTVKAGRSVYVEVKTGIRQANNIEITRGLNEGDSVVVAGLLFTRANGPVKVRGVKDKSNSK